MKLSQNTGEDWNDAKLILSTSETGILNAGVPTSDSLVIEPKPKLPPPRLLLPRGAAPEMSKMKKMMNKGAMLLSAKSYSSESDDDTYEGFVPETASLTALLPEMSEGGAVISKSPMAVNYTVDELTTIPSDDQSHKVLVATIPLEASISHITTPRKSPLAYLQVCRGRFWPIAQLTVLRHI